MPDSARGIIHSLPELQEECALAGQEMPGVHIKVRLVVRADRVRAVTRAF
jgi:hypothetical protein